MAGFNHFPQIANRLPKITSQVVRKVAFQIQAEAASNAPVDTGFLKNSIYTVTSNKSTYGGAVQVAHTPKAGGKGFVSRGQLKGFVKRKARQRTQEAMMLPEVPGPGDDQTAYVAVGANYGIYLEYGTHKMPAQPYFFQAVEDGITDLDDALSKLESLLGGAGGLVSDWETWG
jgi:HK97 gp10 family phage protein